MIDTAALAGRVHHQLIDDLIVTGRCPGAAAIGARLSVSTGEVEAALFHLAEQHAVVLHPDRCAVWVVHPFSCSPTHTFVAGSAVGWWAPCLWCALGIAHLVGDEVVIHARLGGEAEPVTVRVVNGHPAPTELVAHFAVPPRWAWRNVHHHCAMLLPFASAHAIDAWCARHGLERGVAVPLDQAAALARAWYGAHRDEQFRKWTTAEARKIFAGVGLSGEFWALDGDAERY